MREVEAYSMGEGAALKIWRLQQQAAAAAQVITTIFPRIYARRYYAHPRARGMSFSG